MPALELVIDGTNFGGKTPLVAHLLQQLRARGLRAESYAPFREREVFSLWETQALEAATQLRAVMHSCRLRAEAAQLDCIVWDRAWPTAFVCTQLPEARRCFLPLQRHTYLLLNTAETTARKVAKYQLSPTAYPWMFPSLTRTPTTYEALAREYEDQVLSFRPTLEDSRFDIHAVSQSILTHCVETDQAWAQRLALRSPTR